MSEKVALNSLQGENAFSIPLGHPMQNYFSLGIRTPREGIIRWLAFITQALFGRLRVLNMSRVSLAPARSRPWLYALAYSRFLSL